MIKQIRKENEILMFDQQMNKQQMQYNQKATERFLEIIKSTESILEKCKINRELMEKFESLQNEHELLKKVTN